MNFSVLLLILIITEAYAYTIVQTTSGPVRGSSLAYGKVQAFLGIPYAEPPVGFLRFTKPVSKASWEDLYDATQLPLACIQADFGESVYVPDASRTSEDCLYLNLWVPQSLDKSELKPIIIFIHGGAYMLGSSSLKIYNGASLADYGDVIVATVNYRLGGLGFFTAFTDDAPGNMGMHDQLAAIKWIKENAKNFGGDPNNIVLMGQSAGAASVSAHLISPLSKGLFRRAILLSGSIIHPSYSDNNNRLSKLCQEYANTLGCTSNGETLEDSPESIVECLKNLTAKEFSEADTKLLMNLEKIPQDFFSQILYPRIGDDFLPGSTVESFRKGDFQDTEVLLGVTRDEGSMLLTFLTPALFGHFGENDVSSFFNETSTRQFIKTFISTGDESEDDKIIETYMDRVNEEDEYAYVKALSDAAGDYLISCGAVFQADIQSLRNNPIYFYLFDFRPQATLYEKWMGVAHCEELPYVFGNFIYRAFTEYEKEFSRDIMDMLVTFAKTGNPSIPGGQTWPKYTYEDPKYFVIGKKDRVETKPDHNRCEVWRKRYGAVIDDDLIRNLKSTTTH